MPDIIRIRNLEQENNLNGLIIPVDNSGYTSNAKQINTDQLKSWVLSGFTGQTSSSTCSIYSSNTIRIAFLSTTTNSPTTTVISTTTTTMSTSTTVAPTTIIPTTTTTTTAVYPMELRYSADSNVVCSSSTIGISTLDTNSLLTATKMYYADSGDGFYSNGIYYRELGPDNYFIGPAILCPGITTTTTTTSATTATPTTTTTTTLATTSISPTTTTTTTILHYTFIRTTNTYYSSDLECCINSSSIQYGTLYSNVSTLSVGVTLYSNSNLTSPYVGNNLSIGIRSNGFYNYKSIKVQSNGIISSIFDCSSTTTAPPTTTTTTIPPDSGLYWITGGGYPLVPESQSPMLSVKNYSGSDWYVYLATNYTGWGQIVVPTPIFSAVTFTGTQQRVMLNYLTQGATYCYNNPTTAYDNYITVLSGEEIEISLYRYGGDPSYWTSYLAYSTTPTYSPSCDDPSITVWQTAIGAPGTYPYVTVNGGVYPFNGNDVDVTIHNPTASQIQIYGAGKYNGSYNGGGTVEFAIGIESNLIFTSYSNSYTYSPNQIYILAPYSSITGSILYNAYDADLVTAYFAYYVSPGNIQFITT